MKKVFCIIVTYNAQKWIYDCISTIVEDKVDLTILVIDNGSSDETIEVISHNFPSVEIVQTGENLGFGRANNVGYTMAKNANAEYIYLLNQDTKSYPDNIYNLIQLESSINERIGIISPMHLNDDGSKLDLLFESCISSRSCPEFISDAALNKPNAFYPISFVNAAAWLVKVSTVEYLGGLFSEAFFHYGEDLNFGSRLKYFDFEIVIATGIYIHHCRAERNGKHSKDFENKKVQINTVTLMHDIANSYAGCCKNIVKYSLEQLSKRNLTNSIKIILYPILNFGKIAKYRKSYIERNLISNK